LNEDDFIKARLTALAIETDNFARDDIYTLFVTTRIINFLKGLRLSTSASLMELISLDWHDPRVRIGFELLTQLSKEGKLFFAHTAGPIENTRFNTNLFLDILSKTEKIGSQSGTQIDVRRFVQSMRKPKYVALTRETAAAMIGA
jgi:hypothetical protein